MVSFMSPPAREVWVEIEWYGSASFHAVSPPAREVWVEIKYLSVINQIRTVASREGGVG